jgi:tRNA(fMet)-specific endonuclease VapC
VTARLAAVGERAVATSIVVACELRFGVEKKGSTRLAARVAQLLAAIEILPLGRDVDRHYASIRMDLERRGQLIGAHDLLLAAHARSLGLCLVTDNVHELGRVANLPVENWLE